jgi:sugar diacid utilization regulator
MRRLHLAMIDAVLAGEGLQRIAELASAEAQAPIAILIPRIGEALAPASAIADEEMDELRAYVRGRVENRPCELPRSIVGELPVETRDELVGVVVMLATAAGGPASAGEIMAVVAMASLTELAAASAREEAEAALQSSLIELIRGNPQLPEEDILRRAHRLGIDLSMGAVALCAELRSERPRYVMSIIRGEHPNALAEHLDDRIYALLPPARGEDPRDSSSASAQGMVKALAAHATVGFSSFCARPGLFHRAITEAELVVDVLKQGAEDAEQDIRSSTYRLLINTLASRPEEVRQFYEDTVAPLVRYDEQYHTDFAGTVEAYLRHNCNMNATAAAVFAHRHTIAYRLERVRELTGLDPGVSEDRERLGLGLKAYRILATQLRS